MKKILLFFFTAAFLFAGCASVQNVEIEKSTEPVSQELAISEIDINQIKLVDSEAIPNVKKLYGLLNAIYGSKVLTGQMENAWDDNCNMLNRVYTDTNKYPALMGFDFMNYTSLGWSARNKQIERAMNFWNGKNWEGQKISDNHGIVSFMWHWRDPMAPTGKTGEFSSKNTDFRIPYDTDNHCWKTDTVEYKEILKDFDVVARELLRLQKAEIPVIWRPMHEAAGNLGGPWVGASAWFWWGAGNQTGKTLTDVDVCGECYIALWKLMFDYFTKEKGVHNLIWLWNGQNEKFYPGDEYVDIIGDDIYNTPKNYTANANAYKKYSAIGNSKMVTLSECGAIPSMENITKENAWWLYFMVWNDGNSDNGKVSTNTHKDNFWSGEYHNQREHKEKIYNSEIAITLDELPDFTK